MMIRNVIFGIALTMSASGLAWAQDTNANTQSNTNSGGSQEFGGGFGGGSFSFTSGNTTISQSNGADGSFCQFFSFSSGLMQIVQILQGNSMTQTFGSPSSVTDPCI